MTGFFEELKRRKVYRVAVAYVVAAGGIIQLASAIFPAWELPNWALRLVVAFLLGGFPIALIFAWAFDFTPAGIQTTPPLPSPHDPEIVARHRARNIGLLVGIGVLISVVAGYFLLPRANGDKMGKSIAVLPFENFSDQPQNAYFADGIQDDILTNLSKIGDLKVISRTSVMAYRGKQKNIRQIGKELGVSAILEGSVRTQGNRVRVNVQLINAANDQHIWAEDYDRDLTDVFAIQTDLAKKIAHELQAKLSPSEQEQMTHRPTENGEAYLAFVQAHNLNAALEDRDKLKEAQQLYERAIQLDPKFVLAIANLSILHSWIFHTYDPTEAEREAAKKYAEQALALAPDSPEAHLALGYWFYYGPRDYDSALHEFAIAQQGLPNDSQVYLVIGAIQRRQGKWKESTANLEKAVQLDPNDSWPLQNLFFNYQMQRQFDAARRVIDRALALKPDSMSLWGLKARLALAARGDLSVLKNGLARLDKERAEGKLKNLGSFALADVLLAKIDALIYERKFADAIQLVHNLPPFDSNEQATSAINVLLREALANARLNQYDAARSACTRARELAQAAVASAPNDPNRRGLLALALAGLGDKEAAVAEAKRAMELRPESKDAFEGPPVTEFLAQVYALTGQNAKAIEVLDGLLSRPGDLTVTLLQLDPIWDGLRSDPAFQQMLARHGQRA